MTRHHPLPLHVLTLLSVLGLADSGLGAQQQHLLSTIVGPPGENTGRHMVQLGDVDKDGFPELAIGTSSGMGANGYTGTVRVVSTRNLEELYVISGPAMTQGFGQLVVSTPDFNADGVMDLLISAESHGSVRSQHLGAIYLYSGADGTQIWKNEGTIKDMFVGRYCNVIGDIDKDGTRDFGVANKQSVDIYSGKTRSLLLQIHADSRLNEWGPGASFIPSGDIDKDGIDDLILLWEIASISAKRSPAIRAHSGKDGSVLYEFETVPLPSSTLVANVLAGLSDTDSDGIPEFVLVEQEHKNSSSQKIGSVSIHSGKTGKRLRFFEGAAPNAIGYSVHAIQDIDADGYEDFASSGGRGLKLQYAYPGTTVIDVYSGKQATWLRSFIGPSLAYSMNLGVAPAGDMNGDGVPDLAIGSSWSSRSPSPRVGFFSMRPLTMTSPTQSISVFKGGTQVLNIDMGTSLAARAYFMIGSASGTQPGTVVGSLRIPLNFDAYMGFCLAAPNALLWNNLGLLDARGRAQVGFRLPSGYPPTLAGLRLDHAALIIGAAGIEAVSNPLPLNFIRF